MLKGSWRSRAVRSHSAAAAAVRVRRSHSRRLRRFHSDVHRLAVRRFIILHVMRTGRCRKWVSRSLHTGIGRFRNLRSLGRLARHRFRILNRDTVSQLEYNVNAAISLPFSLLSIALMPHGCPWPVERTLASIPVLINATASQFASLFPSKSGTSDASLDNSSLHTARRRL